MTEIPKLIPEISQLASTNLEDPSAVRNACFRLDEMFLQSDNLKDPDVSDLANRNTLKRLQALYEQFETNLENEFAQKLLSGETNSEEEYPLYDRFKRLIAQETELAKAKEDDRV